MEEFLASADKEANVAFSEYFIEIWKDKEMMEKITEIAEFPVTVFGRDHRQVHVVCLNPTLSRKHAAFVHRKNRLYVVDLGSQHGTFVNGERMQRRSKKRLKPDMVIQFGKSTRKYILKENTNKRKSTFAALAASKRRKISPRFSQERPYLLMLHLTQTDAETKHSQEGIELVRMEAVVMETQDLSQVGSLDQIVKPKKKVTNQFLKKNPTIKYQDVQAASDLTLCFAKFNSFCRELLLDAQNTLVVLLGDWPIESLRREAREKSVGYPGILETWCNLKTISSGHIEEWRGVGAALKEFGIKPQKRRVMNVFEITTKLIEEKIVFIPTNRPSTSRVFQESTRPSMPSSFGSNFFR